VYHAGALRALQEAGVKIDIIAGQGVGAAGAALAAIDGASRLWDAAGVWQPKAVRGLYGWRWPLRIAAWIGVTLVAALLTPLVVLAAELLVFLTGFFLEMVGADQGRELVAGYASWLEGALAGDRLPAYVPRIVTIAIGAMIVVFITGGVLAGRRIGAKRAERGWWWRNIGAPLDAASARQRLTAALWDLVRGAAPVTRPSSVSLAHRYADVLSENLGQPGFRELILIATDLDARRDLVAAVLAEPYRRDFFARRQDRDRRSEALDLAGADRGLALEMIHAALTPPMLCDPQLISFAPDSFWRGETHRLCDRPGAIGRLLEEVAEAGATQAIVVSAVAPAAAPHRLRAPRLDVRGRFGEYQSAAEASALRDALESLAPRFEALYVIHPGHNPVGPFDMRGAYDEASDRRQALSELMARAYEDASRDFIEPVIGASGEQLVRARRAEDWKP
jgi:hypothetical protein